MDHGRERIATSCGSMYKRLSRKPWSKREWLTRDVSSQEAAGRYPNVQVVTAYMPEAFGTHHSKMMILFRHDDLAQ